MIDTLIIIGFLSIAALLTLAMRAIKKGEKNE